MRVEMQIRKSFKFILEPSTKQRHLLAQCAGSCRFVFNWALALSIQNYEKTQKSLSYGKLCRQLTELKSKFEWLSESHSQTLQQSIKNLITAYTNFFRRVKKGENPGFPKFKKKGRNESFRYPQGVKILNNKVFLPKIGWVSFRKSQEIVGKICETTVSKKGEHWFVSFSCQIEKDEPKPRKKNAIGVDMGITSFASLSNENMHQPLNSFRRLQNQMKKEQRKLSRKKKFSQNWKKQLRRVKKLHIKIADTRKDYLHKLSSLICKSHAIIYMEDLKISNMSASAKGTIESPGKNVKAKSGLNKAILDQGWYEFRRQIVYKSLWNGGKVFLVPPKYTSQKCSKCGHTAKSNRKTQSKFVCEECGFELNADINAAINILGVGQTLSACRDIKLVEA